MSAPGADRRRRARVALLGAAAGSYTLAALGFAGVLSGEAERWVALDVSASARRGREAAYAEVRRLLAEATSALRAGDRFGLVAFADGTRRVLGPLRWSEAQRSLDAGVDSLGRLPGTGASDFESAIREVLAIASPGADLVLVSDGRETRGDARGAAAAAAAAGLVVHGRVLAPPEGGDLRVDSFALPRRLRPGEAFVARAFLVRVGRAPGRATVRWTADSGEGVRTVEREVSFPEEGSVEASVALGAPERGGVAVRVEVRADAIDRFPENDAAFATSTVGDARRVVVSGSPAFAAAMSRVPGVVVESVDAGDLASAIPRADAVALVDRTARELEPSASLLVRAVEEGGLGLLVAGTRRAFGPGGYGGSAIARVLPVLPEPPADGGRSILVLVDASGSMEGAKFDAAMRALARLAASARPADAVLAAAFGERMGEARRIKAAGLPLAAADLRSIVRHPAGATDVAGSVVEAAAVLAAQGNERRRSLFVVTDGIATVSTGTDPEEAGRALRAARVESHFFAVGPDASLEALDRLAAASGGRRVAVAEAEALAQDFVDAAGPVRRAEERHPRRPGPHAERFPEETPPTFARCRAALRDGANAVYAVRDAEPLLAMWRAGSGGVAAFCSTPGGEEAPAWVGETGVWDAVLSLVARAPSADALRVDGSDLVLETADDAGNETEAVADLGDGARRLLRVGPGRFVGRGEAPAVAAASATVRRGGGPVRPVAFAGSNGPAEFREGGRAVLDAIATASGGAGPSAPLPAPRRRGTSRGSGALFALAGIVALVLAARLKGSSRSADRRDAPFQTLPMRRTVALLLLPFAFAACRSGPGRDFSAPDENLAKRIEKRVRDLKYAKGSELIDTIGWLRRCGEPAFPRLIEVLSDEDPAVRCGAALVLGSSGDRRLIAALQRHREDPDARVRFEVARGLVRLGDWNSLETLIAGLRDESTYVRALCNEALRGTTGLDFGFSPTAAETERLAAAQRWESWWSGRRKDPFFGG